MPTVLRTSAAACALFAVCGYAPAAALVPGELSESRALFVIPLGATVSSLSLTALGLVHIPFLVSLAFVIGAAVLADVRVLRAHPSLRPHSETVTRLALPSLIAALVAAVSLIPIFRTGVATVPGQNPDAILVVGSAKLLQHAPPTARRNDLPINHVPLVWRSKYPIYYALSAVSELAGQDPIAAFAALSAVVLAMMVTGFYLLVRHMLRAPPLAALLAMLLVGLDRIVVHVTIHPFYNELWAQALLPFILLFGWRYLAEPGRRAALAFLLFAVLGLLVYPLMLPFPAIFLGVCAALSIRRHRRAGTSTHWFQALSLPRPRWWMWPPLVVLAVPIVAVLVRGVFEKLITAAEVVVPWGNLRPWQGGEPFHPFPTYVGMPGAGVLYSLGLAAISLLALSALTRAPSDVRRPLRWMLVIGCAAGVYFRLRTAGQLFDFRDLAFIGPYLLALAVIALTQAAVATRRLVVGVGALGLAVLLFVVPLSAAREINETYVQASPSVLALRTWSAELPRNSSIRIDVPPSGYELWAAYMLHDHRLSTLVPLNSFYPHPALSRKADYVLTMNPQPRPTDAVGQPLERNASFSLWRMSPAVPGPDLSRHGLVDAYTSVPIA